MRFTAVVALFADLRTGELTGWVERGWVRPDQPSAGWEFHEIDVARVRLIHDLRRGMEVAKTPSRWCCRCWIRSTSCGLRCADWPPRSGRSQKR